MKLAATAIFAAAFLGASLASALAADPLGNWRTDDGKATVRITNCGGALCGAIVSLTEPNDPATH